MSDARAEAKGAAARSLPADRPGSAAPDDLVRTRAAIAAAPFAYPLHPGVAMHTMVRNGIPCLELAPPRTRCSIVYLHGGGYRMGAGAGWAGFASLLAARLSARVVLPEYRLAPEHPFPAGLRDAVAALESVMADGGPVIIAGDSAGGGLAVAATLVRREAARALPDAVVLLSPWLDLTLSAETFETNADRDRFFPRASAADAAAQYLQGHAATDPLVSPLFADLRDFPPSLILAGGDETPLADATRFAGRLAGAGTTTESHIVAGMQHIWPVIFPDLPETADAVATITRFIERMASSSGKAPF